jgi:SAM-dependent methyltransferase
MQQNRADGLDDPKEVVRSGYDAASYAYRSDDAPDGQIGRWLSRLTNDLARGSNVLDLGCGCGIPACRWLVRRGYRVTGIDISPVQIERARALVPEAMFTCADMTGVELPVRTFDAVVCLYALIHVPLQEQARLLQEIHGWLRPKGRLMVIVGANAWTGTEEDWREVSGARMFWAHESTSTYLAWLRDAGFSVEWHRFVPEGEGGHTLVVASASAA